jgi:hypothetical protein
MRRSTDPGLFAAGALLALGVLVFGASIARAVNVDMPAVPAADDAPAALPVGGEGAGGDAAEPPADAALPYEALMLAADHDPFRADRQRAPQRYLLPGESLPEPEPPPPGPPPPPPFRLVGTAVTPGGGLAMLQLENTPPRMVAMGESLLGYTVARVSDEGAVLEGPQGQRLSLLIARAVPPGADARAAASGRAPGRGAQGGPLSARDAATEARIGAVERLMQQGGVQSPEMMEALRRLLEAAGSNISTSAVNFDAAGGNVIIRRSQPDNSRPPNQDR